MPKITLGPNEIMKGWALDFSQSNTQGVEAPNGKYSKSRAISLFRMGKIGHIAPGETFTDVGDTGTIINALPINGTVSLTGSSTGRAWIILSNARVALLESNSIQAGTYNATAHTVLGTPHSSLSGEDVLVYKNSTDEYVLYSFNDATDGDVGRMLKDGSSADDDFLSTSSGGAVLTKGVPHKMCIGPDNNVYITNGQYIVRLNASTSAVTMQAFNIGTGFVANDIKVYKNKIIIVGNKAIQSFTGQPKNDCRAWFWDSVSPFYDNIFDLNDNYVSSAFVSGGLFVFTQGKNATTKVKFFNGSDFETVFESFQIGDPPSPGSIDTFQNMIHYGASGTGVMCLDGSAFHFRTQASSDGTTIPTAIGMVKNLFSNLLYVGRTVGGAYKVSSINYAGYQYYDTGSSKNVDFVYPIIGLPYKSTITKVRVYFSQFGTGASITVSGFKNYATISVGGSDDIINKTLTYSSYGAISSVNIPVLNGFDTDCFTINLRLNHTSSTDIAAIVRKIEVYYETPEK